MKTTISLAAIGLCLLAATARGEVTAPGAKLELLAGEFKFTEGPSADTAGNVYFTDQPNDRIMVWTVDGKLETFMQPSGRSNGLYFDAKGQLWACADDKNELWRIDPKTKQHTVVVDKYDGKLLNGPNDLWCHPNGSVYFTDPFYKRPYWNRGPSEQVQAVYRLSPDHQTVVRVADDLEQPNGLIGTPDGKQLYVADIKGRKTYRYDIGDDGALKNKTLFCEPGSDGMTLDADGNVYLTGKGVLVFNPKGEKIQQIDVPEGWTANVCFGGKDNNRLFITASKGLYSIEMQVKGAAAK
jgi:gluconolactonase